MTKQRRINSNDVIGQYTIGFDSLFNHLLDGTTFKPSSYPPYNIIKLNPTDLQIEIAIAGIPKQYIEVSVENNFLRVTYNGSPEDNHREYIHRGIADRKFMLEWALKDRLEVSSATCTDGILKIAVTDKSPQSSPKQTIAIQ